MDQIQQEAANVSCFLVYKNTLYTIPSLDMGKKQFIMENVAGRNSRRNRGAADMSILGEPGQG